MRVKHRLLGRISETFVLAQLRLLLGADRLDLHAFHLRQQEGRRETDVIRESADGRVVGVEIKATASAGSKDARLGPLPHTPRSHAHGP